MKYKYKGRGERVVTSKDFASLGVEHDDVYFTEDDDCVQDLSDEAAQALLNIGEPLVPEEEESEPEDPAVEGGGEDPTVEDNVKIVDKELAEDEIEKAKTTKTSTRKKN